MSKWTALCDGRGGGERVLDRGATRRNFTDREGKGGIGHKGTMKRSRKLVETGGAGELE